MNKIFAAIILVACLFTGYQQLNWIPATPDAISPMKTLSLGIFESAKASVTLVLGLIGVMAFFLGLMKIAENGGLLVSISKLLRPLMIRLFPEVPTHHPAMGAMIMNISANMMGLGNAATPFGIRAMQELDKLNPVKGTATNAMCLFLAINTSSVTLLPLGVIGIRSVTGSLNPAAIVPTTLLATLFSTIVAIIAAKTYQRFTQISIPLNADVARDASATESDSEPQDDSTTAGYESYPTWVSFIVFSTLIALVPAAFLADEQTIIAISDWFIPSLIALLIFYGLVKRVPIYESFVEGAKDGFEIAVRIIPYLVAILVAIGMLRNSGFLLMATQWISQFTAPLGLPGEALPMALLRPLSGSGAYGVMVSILEDPNIGPDSYIGYLVSTLQGSTETTFYVLALYFGAVQIKRVRHALAAGLTADIAGVIAAVVACTLYFSSVA